MINYYWPPSGGSAVQRWLDITRHFDQLGIQSYVITIDERIATYPFRDEKLLARVAESTQVYRTDSAELFHLYDRMMGRKPKESSANDPKESSGFLNKIARFVRGNFILPDPRRGWNRYAFQQAELLLREIQFDAVFTAGPPQSTHLVGLNIKKQFPKVKWIADFHDYWTDHFNLKSFYRTRIATYFDKRLEKKVLRNADFIMTHCRSSKKLLTERIGAEMDKIWVHTMGYNGDLFADKSYKYQTQDSFVIVYTGMLLENYSPNGFLEALQKLIISYPSLPIKLKIAGYVYEHFFQEIARFNVQAHFEFVGYVSQMESVQLLKEGSMVLLINPRVPNSERIVPGKIYEYFGVEKPILSISKKNSENEVLIQEMNAGSNYDYDDVPGIYHFLEQQLKLWQEKGHIDLPASDAHTQYVRTNEIVKLAKNVL